MTAREAIEILNELHDQCCQADSIFCTDVTGARCDAVDMAIEALSRSEIPNTSEPKCADGCIYGWGSSECGHCDYRSEEPKTGDCISRQAAIDEWKNDFKGYINALNMPKDDYNGIMEYIDEFPSAQPTDASCWGCNCQKMERLKEQKTFSEMVHLHDAETHDKRTKTHACDLIDRQAEIEKLREYVGLLPHDLTDIADKAIDALASQQRWIPCSERLPDECGNYLVTEETVGWNMLAYGTTDIAYFDTVWHKADKVLAWMPLPEPYRKDGEADG